METFSLTDLKRKNLSDVYHFIYGNPGCSKQTIANALSISLPTVTQHLTTLLDEELIEKCGQLASNVGRKATAYQTIPTARIAIGIEILPRHVYIVSLNLYGKKEVKEKINLSFEPTKAYSDALRTAVTDFLEKHHYTENQLLGIGLGVQGLTSPDGTEVTYGEILNCTGWTIDDFSGFFSVPCKFIHDVECASNSELWENPELQNAIYISLGEHLGGAVIINGILQNGSTGKTGTFEHMTLVPDGLNCYCGKKGCAECYCSGNSLLESDMEFEDFFSKKENGDIACNEKWNDYLKHLSMLINNLHMVLEIPVILGGHVGSYFQETDLKSVTEMVETRNAFRDDASYILLGKCRYDAVSIGAALPFIKEFIDGVAL